MKNLNCFNSKKISEITTLTAMIILWIVGFIAWSSLTHLFLIGSEHPKKYFMLALTVVWTAGLIYLSFTHSNKILRLYHLLGFVVYSFLYTGWVYTNGFLYNAWPIRLILSNGFLFNFILLLFVILFILICFIILKNKERGLSKLFTKNHLRELFIILLLLSMSFFLVQNKYGITENGVMEDVHKMYFTDRNFFPPDHRILVPYMVEATSIIFRNMEFDYLTNITRLYKIYTIITLTAAFYLYYYLLKIFFRKDSALLISVLLFSFFCIAFNVGGLTDDPLNLLSFVIGLILIYYRRDFFLWILILISSFGKETVWFLVFMYFVHNSQWINKKNWKWTLSKTSILALTFIMVSLIKITIKPIHSSEFNWIIFNLSCGYCLLYVFLILNIFWITALFFAEHPPELKFFSRLNFVTPFFIAWHYLGLMREIRFFIIIGLILLPLGIGLLFPNSLLTKNDKTNNILKPA